MWSRPAVQPRGPRPPVCAGRRGQRGFTLIELLVVAVIIAIIAALLLPALGAAKSKSKTVSCLGQLKQFAAAAQMYSGDNNGLLVINSTTSETNGWVGGSMKVTTQATDPALIRQARLFPYVGQAALFHCPADDSRAANATPRLRSYAMNSWIGGRSMEAGGPGPERQNFRTFVKDAEFAVSGAASVWLLADEHETTIDDGFFLVTMNDAQPFASFPALRHQHGFGLNFVDGHAESWRLRDPESNPEPRQGRPVSAKNSDWLRLKQATTVPQ